MVLDVAAHVKYRFPVRLIYSGIKVDGTGTTKCLLYRDPLLNHHTWRYICAIEPVKPLVRLLSSEKPRDITSRAVRVAPRLAPGGRRRRDFSRRQSQVAVDDMDLLRQNPRLEVRSRR